MQVIALLILLQIASEAASQQTQTEGILRFSAFDKRVVIVAYRGQKIIAATELDCVRSLCVGSQSSCCAVSFNKRTGECVRATRSAPVIAAALEASTDVTSGSEWSTYLPSDQPAASAKVNFGPSLEPPSSLWMLDAENKGRNLGSKGGLCST